MGRSAKAIAFRPLLFPEILSSYNRLPLLWACGFLLPSKNINRASVTIAWELYSGRTRKGDDS